MALVMAGFGVRQLAAALSPASLLGVISASGQQAGRQQSGSKLPHSKPEE